MFKSLKQFAKKLSGGSKRTKKVSQKGGDAKYTVTQNDKTYKFAYNPLNMPNHERLYIYHGNLQFVEKLSKNDYKKKEKKEKVEGNLIKRLEDFLANNKSKTNKSVKNTTVIQGTNKKNKISLKPGQFNKKKLEQGLRTVAEKGKRAHIGQIKSNRIYGREVGNKGSMPNPTNSRNVKEYRNSVLGEQQSMLYKNGMKHADWKRDLNQTQGTLMPKVNTYAERTKTASQQNLKKKANEAKATMKARSQTGNKRTQMRRMHVTGSNIAKYALNAQKEADYAEKYGTKTNEKMAYNVFSASSSNNSLTKEARLKNIYGKQLGTRHGNNNTGTMNTVSNKNFLKAGLNNNETHELGKRRANERRALNPDRNYTTYSEKLAGEQAQQNLNARNNKTYPDETNSERQQRRAIENQKMLELTNEERERFLEHREVREAFGFNNPNKNNAYIETIGEGKSQNEINEYLKKSYISPGTMHYLATLPNDYKIEQNNKYKKQYNEIRAARTAMSQELREKQ
jgi:hypothetical protein